MIWTDTVCVNAGILSLEMYIINEFNPAEVVNINLFTVWLLLLQINIQNLKPCRQLSLDLDD